MANVKISISISPEDLGMIDAIKKLEKRGSRSNTLVSLLDYSGYEFIEIINKNPGKASLFLATKV